MHGKYFFTLIYDYCCYDGTFAAAGKDIVPYLPQLMDFLLTAVTSAPSYHAKSLAISAIGAAGIQIMFIVRYLS